MLSCGLCIVSYCVVGPLVEGSRNNHVENAIVTCSFAQLWVTDSSDCFFWDPDDSSDGLLFVCFMLQLMLAVSVAIYIFNSSLLVLFLHLKGKNY